MSIWKGLRFGCVILALAVAILAPSGLTQRAKFNGDLYMVNETELTTVVPTVDLEGVMNFCNESFLIPMAYLVEFNSTGELPNTEDKTGMCYIRCFYETAGFLENWKLNVERIRQYMWPASGDSIDYCQHESSSEVNPCVRVYAIAKCLMIRALVDARNNPVA